MKFSFGRNWRNYARSLNETTIETAKSSILALVGDDSKFIEGRKFLDIGCGSGLFMIAADRLGAKEVIGIDIDPLSVETSKHLVDKYGVSAKTNIIQGSILDRKLLGEIGKADFVYGWGSLHHTGSMWEAITNAAELVADGGILVIAIYKKHKTSNFWKRVKRIYNVMPAILKFIMVIGYLTLIIPYKLLILKTGLKDESSRGMRLYYDAVDWLGGWPYEFASIEEIHNNLIQKGFKELKTIPCHGMTGCNQFVYRKKNV